jgi:hypothetical protein
MRNKTHTENIKQNSGDRRAAHSYWENLSVYLSRGFIL